MKIQKIKAWVLPSAKNQYAPCALRHKAITFYLLIIFGLKAFLGFLFFAFPETAYQANNDAATIERIVELANKARTNVGLPALNINSNLNQSALLKAQDMMSKQYFAHNSPEGVEPWYWFEKVGYTYVWAGENLALGFETNEAVHEAWMNSEGHRENILKPNFDEIGVAIAHGEYKGYYTTIIVQHFGSTENSKPQKSPNYSKEPPKATAPSRTNLDKTAPLPPKILGPTDNSFTNKKEFTLIGSGEKNATILIYEKNVKIGQTKASAKNAFKYKTNINFNDGIYSFKAQAVDAAGNKSAFSKGVKVTLDTVAPMIDLADSYLLPNYLKPLQEYDVFVYVLGNPQEVRAISGSKEIKLISKGNNLYRGTIQKSDAGIWIKARDKAGNVSSRLMQYTQTQGVADYNQGGIVNQWQRFVQTMDQGTKWIIGMILGIVALLFILNTLIHIRKQNAKLIIMAILTLTSGILMLQI